MATMIVSSEGHITIPKTVLARLGLKPGDKIDVSINARGELVIRRASGSGDTLRGIFKRPERSDSD